MRPVFLLVFMFLFSPFSFAHLESNPAQCKSAFEEIAPPKENDVISKGRKLRGYSILVGTMVGSAAVGSYLTSLLPAHTEFLTGFIGVLSGLGFYEFSAPIREPLNSTVRKFSFIIKKYGGLQTVNSNKELDQLWARTQENYSLNSQMSRNIINNFILSAKQNFYEAHRAMVSENEIYAIDQIAEAAYRMRMLFREVEPNDSSVAGAIKTSFLNHVKISTEFSEKVFDRIKILDSKINEPQVSQYYREALKAWIQ